VPHRPADVRGYSEAVVIEDLEVRIVLAPLGGGPSTPELTAAVSKAGGLGFLAGSYLSVEALQQTITATRRLTDRAFGVNVFAPVPGPAEPETYHPYLHRVRTWAERHGLPVGEPRFTDDDFDDKVTLLHREAPAVVSFTFGCPDSGLVASLQSRGCEVWVTVTSPEEAATATAAGADALIAQGSEAGGHRGGYADDDRRPIYGLLARLQLLSAEQRPPLVASGGIATGGGIAAALAAGASAAQLGTAFMLCPEAGTSQPHRDALLQGNAPTTLTRAFSGRLARGIRNRFIDELDRDVPCAYPEIHYLTSPARKAAREAGDAGAVNLWAGEAYPLTRAMPAASLIAELGREARNAGALAASRLAGDRHV
jgi:nitronate monooxygenase